MTNESVQEVSEVSVSINGVTVNAPQGQLLIEACEDVGVHVPRFCYHKRMDPVGMCRMCLVEVDTGRGPQLAPSCMIPVTDEMVVETESDKVIEAQDGVLELLLANHPLDCPVCDKGGECPLQDNALSYGAGESRFVEEKRHYEKPIPVNDIVLLDRERCILCDRCTRFADEVAGEPLIQFIDRGSSTQVNTFPNHPFASYYSGNTVQICPVGALTAEPYRFKARPWDLEAELSTSSVDSVGSRVMLQSSHNKLIRIQGVDSDPVNWGWLGDKERFIFEANNSENRFLQPMRKSANGRSYNAIKWHQASKEVADHLFGPDSSHVACIGGSRLGLESQLYWSHLLSDQVGTANIDSTMGDCPDPQVVLSLPQTTYDQALAPGSTVVVLGQDLRDIAPSFYLRLRHGVVKDGVKLIEVSPKSTGLSKIATLSIRQTGAGLLDVASEISKASGSESVTVVYTEANPAESPKYLEHLLIELSDSIPRCSFLPMFRRGNMMGALMAGLWSQSRSIRDILKSACEGEIETLVLLGADPVGDFVNRNLALDALSAIETVVSVDCLPNESNSFADYILPSTMAGETDGVFVNSEGRATSMRTRVSAPGVASPEWLIGSDLSSMSTPIDLSELRGQLGHLVDRGGQPVSWEKIESEPDGVLLNSTPDTAPAERISTPTSCENGTLRLVAERRLWDTGTMVGSSRSLASLAEPISVRMNPVDCDQSGVDKSKSVKVTSPAGSLVGNLVLDASVAPGVVIVPVNAKGGTATALVYEGDTECFVEVANASVA